jgi:DNA-binding response OmpR family regulator
MRRVLIIDDDPMVLATVARVLKGAGFAVQTAANGLQGLRHLAASPCDIVITDLIMPGIEGIEFIRRARDEGHAMPILVISGGGRMLASGDLLPMALNFGGAATLAKPVTPDELLAAVRRCLPEG